MKANNLSISIPNYGCNKNCPYCISKMTGYEKMDIGSFNRNINKVFNISNKCNAIYLTFTSKGEILYSKDSYDIFLNTLKSFKDYFVCEIQTNGLNLTEDNISQMAMKGINTIAVSIDSFTQIRDFERVWEWINEEGITSRITVNLTNDTYFLTPEAYLKECKNFNVDQVSFRRVTIPNNEIKENEKSKKTRDWIYYNINEYIVDKFLHRYNIFLCGRGKKIRDLPYNASIYNVDGISFTYFDYCIQDKSSENDIRSLIYHEDGHLSTTWYGSNIGRIL